ncbi:MAG: iron-containing alcohol dehydrogenase [Eubacterium sp.]|nr:iron-containing alcohol dehydrogenase [Eubacterium sp.]
MANTNPFSFYSPVQIIYGKGAVSQLGDIPLPGTKAVIVTANDGSMDAYAERVQKILAGRGVEALIYAEVQTNPTEEQIDRGAAFMVENGCDLIIALGGGSSIDCSKGMAVVVKNGGHCWDYAISGTGGKKPITEGAVPIISIPTTSGTGSEVSCVAVVSNEKTHEKMVFLSPAIFSRIAILDPELTYTVPKGLTAFQGFDAFTHALEGYLHRKNNALTDLYACKAIELVVENLPRTLEDGINEEARANMALASNLAGIVLAQVGSVSMHPIEHAMSAYYPHLPHGCGLAVIFEEYYRALVKKGSVNGRLIELAKVMGEEITGETEEEQAMAFVRAGVSLLKNCGIYDMDLTRFGMTDLTDADIEAMVEQVWTTSGTFANADAWQFSREDVKGIYERSLLK